VTDCSFLWERELHEKNHVVCAVGSVGFDGVCAEQTAAFRVALYGQGARVSLPRAFSLSQNSPNPFNPSTTIKFQVPQGSSTQVTLKVFDIGGRLVVSLVDGAREAGSYSVFWDGADRRGRQLASGVYFYRMTAGSFVRTRKMVLLK
jgi:FlgD Ig-like domain